jgi:N-acetylglucosamine repressor
MENGKSYRAMDLKELNRSSVLQLLRKNTYSRADISSILGLSKPAVSSLVDELIQENLIMEIGFGMSTESGGKRPIMLKLNDHAGIIVALDINERWFSIALTSLSIEEIVSYRQEITINKDYRMTFEEIVEHIRRIIAEAQDMGYHQPVLACGVSLKGLVNTKEGTLQYSSSIPVWTDIPVRDYLSESLGIPVFIENNARAITIAELMSPKSSPSEDSVLVCVNINLGIGTGVAIRNEIYRGAFDGAVTFAHTVMKDDGPLCRCGNQGCWETLASDTAFLQQLHKHNGNYASLDLPGALAKYHEGDLIVRETLLNYTGYWIGAGIANILNVLNPDHLIILGELTEAGKDLKEKIEEVAKSRALPVSRKVRISFSNMKGNISLKGAATIVLHHFFNKSYHRKIWKRAIPSELTM